MDQTIVGRGADAFFGASYQEASTPTKQDISIPVEQQASEMGSQDAGKLVLKKATYYITQEQNLKLERVRLRRISGGEEIDKSAIIRELIDGLEE